MSPSNGPRTYSRLGVRSELMKTAPRNQQCGRRASRAISSFNFFYLGGLSAQGLTFFNLGGLTSPEASLAAGSSTYRGTSLIRNSADLGPYSRVMPRALWWSQGGGLFLMSEVPLYLDACRFEHLPLPLTWSSQAQGYLDHKKQPPPRTLHLGPMVVPGGWVFLMSGAHKDATY
jgi:hypothetical protein